MPSVSIALPVYNGAQHIAHAIESVLAQDWSDLELIITDNASDDATQEICESYVARDKRVRYVRHPSNLGAAPNYNSGFELATGDFFKWCAHDDTLSSNYISACKSALEWRPDATLAFGQTIGIDTEGRELGLLLNEMGTIADAEPTRRFLRAIREAATCFPIFGLYRTDALRRSTLHRSYYGSDRGLITEMALLGPCLLVPEATFFNREHPARSINISDLRIRSKWQGGRTDRRASMEHVNLAGHLIEIAQRHPDVVGKGEALLALSGHLLSPPQIARYGMDCLRFFSPTMAFRLRNLVRAPFAKPQLQPR